MSNKCLKNYDLGNDVYSQSFLKHKQVMMTLTEIAQEVLIAGQEMPIITLLTFKDEIIALNYNKTNENKNGIHHGEYLTFRSLPAEFIEKHIEEVTLYVNVEPCIMCESMIQQMGVKQVVFGCENERFGASLLPDKTNHANNLQMIPYILRKESIITLRQFYLQENKNAPKTRRKEGRLLDLNEFPSLHWKSYFTCFEKFASVVFDSKKIQLEDAKKIYFNDLDLEEIQMDLIKLKSSDAEYKESKNLLDKIETQVIEFWLSWKEPKKRKSIVK
ncbi:hypothetical protein QEN19_001207 [Hanseniaspora menglaensis]